MTGKDLFAALSHVDDALVTEAETYTSRRVIPMSTVRWLGALAACFCLLVGWAVAARWDPMDLVSMGGAFTEAAMEESTTATTTMESTEEENEGAMEEAMVEEETTEETMEEGGAAQDVTDEERGFTGDAEPTEAPSMQESYTIIDHYTGDDKAIYCYAEPENGTWFCEEYLRQMVEMADSENAAVAMGSGTELRFLVAFHLWKDGEMIDPDSAEYTAEVERLMELGYEFRTLNVQHRDKGVEIRVCGLFTAEQLTDFDALVDYGYIFYFPENEDGTPLDWEDQAFLCGLPEIDEETE